MPGAGNEPIHQGSIRLMNSQGLLATPLAAHALLPSQKSTVTFHMKSTVLAMFLAALLVGCSSGNSSNDANAPAATSAASQAQPAAKQELLSTRKVDTACAYFTSPGCDGAPRCNGHGVLSRFLAGSATPSQKLLS